MRRPLHWLLILAYVCLLTTGVAGQNFGTIRGSVNLQSDNGPVHTATIRIMPSGRTTQTGLDGTYEFRNVPPGRYDVIAHMHALADEKRTVDVTAGGTAEANFRLKLAVMRQEITVTASGEEQTTLETFQTVNSVEGFQLTTRSSSTSLGELLENEPGIAKRSFGPGSSRPVVRGFDGDRVLVLQDGMRSGTLSSQSGDHGEPVDASALERVEVVRGPATLLYGSSAIGGVVNVISSHHQLDEHPHEGVHGSMTAIGGTNNAQGGGSGNFEFGRGSWLFWGGGGGMRTGDYKAPQVGRIENSHSDMQNAEVGLGKYNERASFTFRYGAQRGTYGVPFAGEFHGAHEGETEEEHAEHEEDIDLDWRRHVVRGNGTLRFSSGALENVNLTLNYSDWQHKELEGEAIGTRFNNKQFTWQSVARQRRIGPYSGSFGVWGMQRDFKATGEEALAPPTKQNAFAVFGMEEIGAERFRMQFGARFEHNGYKPQGLEKRTFNGLSASAGLHVPLWKDGALVANYTHSYRAPALEELYNNGPHVGNLAFEIGNANLTRERGNGFEASLRHQSPGLRAELNTFYYRFSDYIFLAYTDQVEDGLAVAEYLQGGTRYMGAEARLDGRLHPKLWGQLSMHYVDAELRDASVPLPRIPPLRARVGVDYRANGLSIRPELILSSRQSQIYFTETPTAGYAVFNVSGSYTIARQHTMHVFNATLFNAGDRLYRNHLSFIKEFAPEIGRGVRVSYTLNFY